jgi:uncharacterized protein with NAD-binding domain and iron-sulfur cluster
MSQVLDRENWKPADQVQNIAYFCGPLLQREPQPPFSDSTYPAKRAARVKEQALAFLKNEVHPLWPNATDPGNPKGLNWNWLVDPLQAQGENRFDRQYWRANIDPSERYVNSVAGSTQYRLPPGGSGFSNLFLAGDWTLGGWNSGCFEGAVISGFMASRAICGAPQVIVGETDLV